ncbi:GMC family oxidoreductase [Streptomyces iranensis]|uniref:Choline dehydrogenase-like flavoprotein n=1 Tax=Streptomyces iranensis TaxID=576784 RepID=A0A061A079_9ACTN|nr:GMC family oxidoreductase N-terminal domain-containing protein [Streptomyces iranensis]MBP2060105.1 choline dehydrogenase-like flavoprotein [Streptomyces iranensis]CDR13960.1 glucose-methanol-choline oxidoreductase [Streptomyces iranensis]
MAQQDGSFDYVIAGGGTAGCVLAGRLSADASVRVLLLEAGRPDRHPFIHVPAGFAKLTAGPYQWGFVSEPQEHCAGRRIPLAQGKVIGGGGSINAQVFTRGVAQDYDDWADVHGCEGWSAKEVRRYFVRSERNERLSGPLHGTEGPLSVSDLVNPHPLSQAFVRAGQEFGLPYNSDFNGAEQYGVGLYQTTTRHSRRCSAAVGYLRPARGRENLVVKTGALVRRVVTDHGRATGIETVEGGTTRRYTARREVIVAAGAFGSPKILQLSGIGDPADLKQAGIEVVHALPGVGKNLQDHCDLDIVYELTSYQSMDRYERPLPATAAAAVQYAAFRRGPMASTVVEAGGFAYGDEQEPTPDLQFHFLPAAGVEAGIAAVRRGYGCTLNSYFLRPRSRGTVRVAGPDPSRAPLIDPNYLADDHDLEMSIEGVRQSREIMGQPSMAPHIKAEHLAGGRPVRTKDDYIAFVRGHGRTAYHPVGTCAMGDSDESVVSPRLKVHGLRGLRVVDSSIMPRIVSSNTQAPTVMIAEHGSDMIVEDAR